MTPSELVDIFKRARRLAYPHSTAKTTYRDLDRAEKMGITFHFGNSEGGLNPGFCRVSFEWQWTVQAWAVDMSWSSGTMRHSEPRHNELDRTSEVAKAFQQASRAALKLRELCQELKGQNPKEASSGLYTLSEEAAKTVHSQGSFGEEEWQTRCTKELVRLLKTQSSSSK